MNRSVVAAVSGCAAVVAGCAPVPAGQAPPARAAYAMLQDAQGNAAGTADLAARGADSVRVTVRLAAAAAGPHGVHLHRVGSCSGPGFSGAGAHLDPFGRQHGHRNPRGAHAGDLGNVTQALTVDVAVPLDSVLDADGAAVVVHERADDELTDPGGNSGARIWCGVLTPLTGRRRAP